MMIRKVKQTDYPRLMEIWESSVLATHDFLAPEDFAYYQEHLPTYFGFVSLWAKELEGRLVGFIGVAANSLEMLFIDAGIRGQGVGKQLLHYSIQELGVTAVEVNEQNGQAVGFYQHMGFEIKGSMPLDAQGKPYPILQLELTLKTQE